MPQTLRLRMEYWKDSNRYVGRVPQVPGVFSQGATLDELERNIRDACRLMLEEHSSPDATTVETRRSKIFPESGTGSARRRRRLVNSFLDALAYHQLVENRQHLLAILVRPL